MKFETDQIAKYENILGRRTFSAYSPRGAEKWECKLKYHKCRFEIRQPESSRFPLNIVKISGLVEPKVTIYSCRMDRLFINHWNESSNFEGSLKQMLQALSINDGYFKVILEKLNRLNISLVPNQLRWARINVRRATNDFSWRNSAKWPCNFGIKGIVIRVSVRHMNSMTQN